MNEDIIELLSKDMIDDEDFEKEWTEQKEEKEEYKPPKYILNNKIALYSQLAHIMAIYFHAKHGQPLNDVFENILDVQCFNETPVFHL